MDAAKEEFMTKFGADYGYPGAEKNAEEIRASEFKRLKGMVYLDHAGATLYSEAQMEAVSKDLTSNVYGNPHSQSDSSIATSEAISRARQQVLELCNASEGEYSCIFTSGATAGLKLVGEAFPWSKESCYMYTTENHNSVLGIREYAHEHGASVLAVDIDDDKLHDGFPATSKSVNISNYSLQRRTALRASDSSQNDEVLNLFAFPSECNFSGRKFHLDLVEIIKRNAEEILEGSTKRKGRWMVLIDAAKGCTTDPPDLSKFPADFTVFSFYKIFGYPTGLGALIIRHDAAKCLRKTYFSGGTVLASIASIDFVKRREKLDQLFEDGTVPFLSIASIQHGLKIINTLTMHAIRRHTASLATFVRETLVDLKHGNGAKVCVIYGRNIAEISYAGLGPIIAFNLKRQDGSWVGHREVEKMASLSGIHLRTGCFCNPGACAKYLELSLSDLMTNLEAGHVCWDDYDILNGKPTGAVRISFGYMSVFEDAWKFLKFIEGSFVSGSSLLGGAQKSVYFPGSNEKCLSGNIYLKSITIYPIKSCAGFNVDSWPLCSTGLRHDREWLLKSPTGEILTQKKVPDMSKILTLVDLDRKMLIIDSPNCKEKLCLSVEVHSEVITREELDVHGQRYEVQEYGKEVNDWFYKAISRPCILVRCQSSKYDCPMNSGNVGNACRDENSKLNFVNEGQLLLVSSDSVRDLNARIQTKHVEPKNVKQEEVSDVDSFRFRPNIVTSGSLPYAEDSWRHIQIGRALFLSVGRCNRCQMINFDPLHGKSKEPLATLASYRRIRGKIFFGILLRYENSLNNSGEEEDGEPWIHVGQIINTFPN